jgi:site-specific DNA recombinase
LSEQQIYTKVCAATEEELSVRLSPHLFRDALATGIATDDPEHIRMASRLLGHADPRTTERHYIHAQAITASRRYNGVVLPIRERGRGRLDRPGGTLMRVAVYARYSSDHQREASIEDQLEVCRRYVERQGWTLQQTYSDRALSGASMLRPGYQLLLQDAREGQFDVVVAEALDRLSCDQEDVAALHKRLSFAAIRIVTLAEGEITELHVGMKGTMNALFLKDLAQKTRRGLQGRIEAGRSGGGNSYGYDVVKRIDDDGEPIRGERRINPEQAAIVRRIFEAYAAGASPKAIARALNREKVPGPRGRAWGPSTIHGQRRRRNGILNNELYVGRLIWNRLRFIKDPQTGKRVARFNPEAAKVVREVPELRIIDDALWDAVKARQGALEARITGDGVRIEDCRRPRYLFSGLLRCGVCGGSFVKYSHDRLGCATARAKGTCDNLLTIKRPFVEACVLNGLRHHLMDPARTALFCQEYTRHLNEARMQRSAAHEGYHSEFDRVNRDLDRLVQAILDGVPGSRVKDRMAGLEARKAELEVHLAEAVEEPVLLHPNMAEVYRAKVARLVDALNDEHDRTEAAEVLRGLIDRIVLTPKDEDGCRSLSIDLEGALAGVLALATSDKRPLAGSGLDDAVTTLVAGARNHLNLLFDAPHLGR